MRGWFVESSFMAKLLGFLLLFATLSAGALESVHAVAQAVDDHYNQLHTLKANFTEIYRGSGMDRTESGILWLEKGGLKKPGKMRWEYRSPKAKLFVSDGKDAWFYVPDDHQARRTDARKLDDIHSPLAFLLGKTQLEKELRGLSYAPDVTPAVPGDVMLRGIPQHFSDRVSEMVLEVNPQHEIVGLTIDDVDGSVTEYRFTDQQENAPLPGGWFHFRPPAGTETVEGMEP
jgi:outer membrane lipoprotein carrier protein